VLDDCSEDKTAEKIILQPFRMESFVQNSGSILTIISLKQKNKTNAIGKSLIFGVKISDIFRIESYILWSKSTV